MVDELLSVSDGLPPKLKEFLFQKGADGVCVRKFPSLRVILGPYNKSYWADDGTAYRWFNLPASFHKHLKGLQTASGDWIDHDTPRIVALGANDNFAFITKRNRGLWNLPDYRELGTVIDNLADRNGGQNKFALIHRIVLNPYRLQCGILQAQNGTAFGVGLPPHSEEAFRAIEKAVRNDTLARTEATLVEPKVLQLQQATNTRSRMALLGMMQGFNLSNNS